MMGIERATLRVTNIPLSAVAQDLLDFFESKLGVDSVFAIEIFTAHKNWKSRGSGRVQFATIDARSKAKRLSEDDDLIFMSRSLELSTKTPDDFDINDIVDRPIRSDHRIEGGALHVGFMTKDDCLHVLERWEGVRGWIMPDRKRLEFWVESGGETYKLELQFDDVLEAVGCGFNGSGCKALLLRVRYAPRIYQKVSGPNVASKFSATRYRICKENFDFVWVRTTDFSRIKSIGQSTSFYWEFNAGLSISDMSTYFPCFKEEISYPSLETREEISSPPEIVPLVNCPSDSKLAYEVIFQLNSLVHSQKISIHAVDNELIGILSDLPVETAVMILQKLRKLRSPCYNPVSFVKEKLPTARSFQSPLSLSERLKEHNVMSCHRVLVTPTKIYCMGPELEKANYVVKNFAEYASDFMRVTFVEEDWSRISAHTISARVQQGIFPRPSRTRIYERILSVLRNGIVIGDKRFEFLAFSASQLRSNSVWMFASNDEVKAKDIREWMGCFKKIRSISKCASRMGQLFSSSLPTLVVPDKDVEIIGDIEVKSNGINYCFSDGIGKMSLPFAREVAKKCGLDHTPSAFQIRYGGLKGVIAVDPNSPWKMSLRNSMLKFESKNMMLNVTSWSKSMSCFLNREIITLLSTLGIKDEVFERMQVEQLDLQGQMLTNKKAALYTLQSLVGVHSKNILVEMLQFYEPNLQPYLSMMLQAHYESLLSDLRSKCRIYVPRGRILIGCLDETDTLDYGQVYLRIKMKKEELSCADQSFFWKVDEETAIVIGKVVVTRNPCLHPGDVRVLEAVCNAEVEKMGLVDCLVFPQNGERPHPNECSGGDLDGDQFFITWDKDLIPTQTDPPMDYSGRRPRIMDHEVTLEEIQKFFVDYMVNDNLGAISNAHLAHADREVDKARCEECLQLATLHSMAVDFAKTGAPAEMPRSLMIRKFPEFMQRGNNHCTSNGVLGKLYSVIKDTTVQARSKFVWTKEMAEVAYDHDLEVNGFQSFISVALTHKDMYEERMSLLMSYYEVEYEDEILTGNIHSKAQFLQRNSNQYKEMKERIDLSVEDLQREAKQWLKCCEAEDQQKLASAWYHVTYHPDYFQERMNCLSFPWIAGDMLLEIKYRNKFLNSLDIQRNQPVFTNVYVKSRRRSTPSGDESAPESNTAGMLVGQVYSRRGRAPKPGTATESMQN